MAFTPQEIIDRFGGTQAKVAKSLGVSRAAVNKWVKSGKVPELRQYQAAVRLRTEQSAQQSATSSRREQMR